MEGEGRDVATGGGWGLVLSGQSVMSTGAGSRHQVRTQTRRATREVNTGQRSGQKVTELRGGVPEAGELQSFKAAEVGQDWGVLALEKLS